MRQTRGIKSIAKRLAGAAVAIFTVAVATPGHAACGTSVQTGYNQNALALATRCGTSVHDLRLANPGVDFNKPLSNRVIRMPEPAHKSRIPERLDRVAPGQPRLLPKIIRHHTETGTQPRPAARTSPEADKAPGYIVRRGDTLSAIAGRRGVTLSRLIAANPGIEPHRLAVGQSIAIPETR